jgi:hypothetical protein
LARRRYGKSPATSTAGQSDRPRDPQTVADEFPLGSEPTAATAQPKSEPEPAHFQTGLGEQIRQQQQYSAQAQLHAYINAIPNLSARQKQWLAANPHALYRFDLLHAAHQMAQHHGIVPDSDDYFRILESALHHYGHLPPQQPAQMQPAPPASPPMASPPMTHVDIEKVENPDHEPDEFHMRAENVSAPVSRGPTSYAMSGEHEPTEGSITLTPQEREIARVSGGEELYARNKLELLKRKKAGLVK